MNQGSETWKWGLVFILLAIFLITANHAYVHMSSLEDFPPPDDYLLGDSWDLEQKSGPGTSQAIGMPTAQESAPPQRPAAQPVTRIEEEIDWGEFEEEDIDIENLIE